MPKVRDLAINAIPSDRPVAEPEIGRYWMSVFPPKTPPKPPQPKPPQPRPPKPKKYAGELPQAAVSALRQQLQQRVKRHDYN